MNNNIEDSVSSNPASDNFQLVEHQKADFLTAFCPDQITKSYDQIFKLIEQKNHKGVEKLLEEHGHVVEMIPKIGCSPLHYGKFNVANWSDEAGDTPLIKALRADSRMVRLLLKYGANPNYTNKERDTPLSIAAVIGDQHIIDALLYAGASLRAAVIKLTSELKFISDEQLRDLSKVGYNIKPLTLLLSDNVYLKTRDPIYSAFQICKEINRIRDVRDEFELEFEYIIDQAEVFTYTFLNYCDKMSEAIEVLGAPQNLLEIAIEHNKKNFIAHPYCQQIVVELWYGDMAHKLFYGKSLIVLKYITSPVILPCLFLKFLLWDLCRGVPLMRSGFADILRLISTPFLCFITDAINFLFLLGSLIVACVIQTHGFTSVEFILFIAALCRLLIEIDFLANQGIKKYCANKWNILDNLVLVLLLGSGVYKYYVDLKAESEEASYQDVIEDARNLTIYYDKWEDSMLRHHDEVMRVNYIYSITEFFLMIRILSLFEISKNVGPMLIALKHLLKDVLVFSVVLLTVILGTAISLFAVVVAMREWNNHIEEFLEAVREDGVAGFPKRIPKQLVAIPGVFSTFQDCVKNVMWSTFGLLDVVGIESEEGQFVDFMHVILILYILMSCVLLLNMLIGILSTTFDRIQENCDIEWKFSRSQLLKEYSSAQPLLFPFFVLFLPFMVWFRIQLKEERRIKQERKQLQVKRGESSGKQSNRDKINFALSDRYRMGTRANRGTGRGSARQDLSCFADKQKKNSFAMAVSAFKMQLRVRESEEQVKEEDFYNQK